MGGWIGWASLNFLILAKTLDIFVSSSSSFQSSINCLISKLSSFVSSSSSDEVTYDCWEVAIGWNWIDFWKVDRAG